MLTRRDREKFERLTMHYLDAAYNLALWLMKNPTDAEDIVQTAYMKAYESFLRFNGENAGGWILTIVRNTAFNLLKKKKSGSNLISFDEALHSGGLADKKDSSLFNFNPEEMLSHFAIGKNMQDAIYKLAAEYREVLFLRELEGYSYKEIAEITNVATGTVMSRLSRARNRLRNLFNEAQCQEQADEM